MASLSGHFGVVALVGHRPNFAVDVQVTSFRAAFKHQATKFHGSSSGFYGGRGAGLFDKFVGGRVVTHDPVVAGSGNGVADGLAVVIIEATFDALHPVF